MDEKQNREGTYVIKKGDRIAQLVFMEYLNIDLEKNDDISVIGENRSGGFGSSGIN